MRTGAIAAAALALATLSLGCGGSSPRGELEGVAQANLRAVETGIDPARLRELVTEISSDELEGRAPGSPGDERTRALLTRHLAEAGLVPGGGDGSWLQPFEIVGAATTAPQLWSFSSPGGRVSLQYLDDFVASAGDLREVVRLADAELVFVGYGIQAPEYDWDDFEDVDVRGKVLLVLNDDPDWDPALFAGAKRLYYGRWTYKLENAAAHGAAGAILIHTPASAGYPWQVVQTSWSGERFHLPAEGGPRLEVEAWVTEDAARRLVESAGFDLEELRRIARIRGFRPVPLGLRTSLELASRIERRRTANVLAILPGADPRRAGEAVVFTAHHDHLGRGRPDEEGDDIYNGAIDNATGVAMVLELARVAATLPVPPRRSLLFALVGAEEQGLLGSRYYALHPTFPPGRLAAALNLDGGNVLGPTLDVADVGRGRSAELDRVFTRVAAFQGRRVKGDEFPDRGYFYRSDQFSLARIGVPALYLHGGTEYRGRPAGWGRRQIDEYTRLRYHQPGDEFDPAWRFDGMAEDARLALLCGLLLADTDAMPAWRPGDEFEAARREALGAAGR